MNDHQPQLPESTQITATISLQEIYDCICPDCHKKILDLLASKVPPELVRRSIRERLEAKPDAS